MKELADVSLPSKLSASLPDNKHKIEVETFGQLSRWIAGETRYWTPIRELNPSGDQFFTTVRDYLSRPIHCGDYLRQLEKAYEEHGELRREIPAIRDPLVQLESYFRGLSDSTYLCRLSNCASEVVDLAKDRPYAALLVAGLVLKETKQRLGGVASEIRMTSLISATIEAAKPTKGLAELQRATEELRDVRQRADEFFNDFAANKAQLSDEHASVIKHCRSELEQFSTARGVEIEATKVELVKIEKAFEEKFRLDAPTDYWALKMKRHRASIMWFGGIFLAAIATILLLIVFYAEPYLTKVVSSAAVKSSDPTGQKSASFELLRLASLIVPAFFGVWILRILGRLLSTHLALYEDAAERVTMVTTFLALASDRHGKTVVTDADRILILTALFRPSSVTASDDSPPAGILELLTRAKSDAGGKAAT